MIEVIAHRGARSLAPENTMAAAAAAFNLGADSWETDVRVTKDGHLVLCHDNTLMRCTDVASRFPGRAYQPVSGFTLDEILSLDAGSFYLNTDPFNQIAKKVVSQKEALAFKTQKIPTLDQALEFTKSHNWRINLELKPVPVTGRKQDLPGRLMQAIGRIGTGLDQISISSFYHSWLDRLASEYPALDIQALIGEDGHSHIDFQDFRFKTYNVNADIINEKDIQILKQHNKKLNLFTVNDPVLFKRFVELGADGIITDFPQWFV